MTKLTCFRITTAVIIQNNQRTGKERVSLAYTSIALFIMKDVRTETQTGQEPGGRRLNAAYWLVQAGLLSLLSYRTQDHQPRDGTTHNGPSLPPSITN